MSSIVTVQVSDLLLDGENPRLVESHTTQQETAINLSRQQGDNIIRLAIDIVKHGLDPTALLAVVATGDARKRYRVLEGNRRILALRALETPSLISSTLSPASNRKLLELSGKYQETPITSVQCVLFDTEDDALHWISLRHTGQNQGVGLVDWGAEEKDRFNSRHSGARNPAGQVLDFVEKRGSLSNEAKNSSRKVQTNLERLLSTPEVRDLLGITVVKGKVVSNYPVDEITKGLTRIVEDLRNGAVTVPDLYKVEQRIEYVEGLPRSVRPRKSNKLAEPVLLDDLTAGIKKPGPAPVKAQSRKPRPVPRTTVIPRSANLNISPPRINAIYVELLSLSAETYSNACSVLLRVFIETSVDNFIETTKIILPKAKSQRDLTLAQRLKIVGTELHSKGLIPDKLKTAIESMANGGQSVFAPTIHSFHQYVHNEYVFPKHTELYVAWDEMYPLMQKLWP
jgi:hypothetical protein